MPADVVNTSSSPASTAAKEVPQSRPVCARNSEPQMSETVRKLWLQMSAHLRRDPAACWESAIANAEELGRCVMGRNTPADVRQNILLNIRLLERTLDSLQLAPAEFIEKTRREIWQRLFSTRIDISFTHKNLEELEALKKRCASDSKLSHGTQS